MTATLPDAPRLAAIVGVGRSGTTLLRYVVDAHPDAVCPSEASVGQTVARLRAVWQAGNSDSNDSSELSARAREAILRAIAAPMNAACEQASAGLYCDKSLQTIDHLDVLHDFFPGCQYVLAFRHVMDVIASGLEASPWGLTSYGYAPYAARSGGNHVLALATQWVECVDVTLKWQATHPDACLAMRYEDLVANPLSEMERLYSFLGLRTEAVAPSDVFTGRAERREGFGDHKIGFTSHFSQASVGRGRTVPVSALPTPFREEVNRRLDALGYPRITETWNVQTSGAVSAHPEHVSALRALVQRRVLPAAKRAAGSSTPLRFALLAEDAVNCRWTINTATGSVCEGDGVVDAVVTGSTSDLASLISGEINPGLLLRAGSVRYWAEEKQSASAFALALRALGIED